jgi:hypothetical protein
LNSFYERPILNSPYRAPELHHPLDQNGQPLEGEPRQGRRPSRFIVPVPASRKKASAGQASLDLETYTENALINEVRSYLKRWRALRNPADWGVTGVTQRLLEHWRHHEFVGPRPFFCQLEAVETIIWLTEANLGEAMNTPSADQTFNDDLLLHRGDRDFAARHYKTIFHVLDHPKLRECFDKYDRPANAAKTRSRILGRRAIILGALAMAGASGEIIAVQLGLPDWVTALAFLPAVAGVASALVGNFGVLFGRNKTEWLHNRLMTERLRQFHFQTFVLRMPEIVASLRNQHAIDEFQAERVLWFEEFQEHIERRKAAAFASVLDEDDNLTMWLHPYRRPLPDEINDRPELQPLFDAYRRLRIEHQLNYARYKLRTDERLFSDAADRQLQVLERLAGLLIAALLLMHVLIAIVITGIAIGGLIGAHPEPLVSAAIHMHEGRNVAIICDIVIIWIAVLALTGRAFEQGLQPGREIERYHHYRSALRAISERFDKAVLATDKIRVMEEMERLAFDEFCSFMITNNNARFVM